MDKDHQYAIDLPRWVTEEHEKSIKGSGQKGLEAISRTEANLGSPKPSSTKCTSGELEIIALGQNYITNLKAEARKLTNSFEKKVDHINMCSFGKPDFKNIVQSYSTEYRKSKQNILTKWNNFKTKLGDKYKDIQEKFNAQDRLVKTYQQNYFISREANSASTMDWARLAIATIVLFSIEVLINRSAIGLVSVGGLNYGLIISIIIATVNVYGSSLIGFAVTKHINDHDKSKRLFYKIISAIYVVFLVYLNWIYAAYRRVSETSMAEFADADDMPMSLVTQALAEASLPWTIRLDVPSIGLLFLGLLFGGFAMYKFYHIDDVIPGYGKIFRKRNNLKEQLDEKNTELNNEKVKLKEEYYNGQTKLYDDKEKLIGTTKKNCDKHCYEYNELINASQRLATKYEDRRKTCFKGINHMNDEYRERNRNIQIEKMPGWKDPIYWKDDIKLDDEEDNVIHIFKDAMALHVSDTQKIETIKSEKAEIDELYSNTRKGLISELEQFNKEPELVLE